MLIGELSNRSGFSRDTIRFYEKHGLIKVRRGERRDNNYKEYSEEILQRLLMVRRIKGFGFTLNETLDTLTMMEANEASCQNLSHKMDDKIKHLDDKIRELIEIRSLLLKSIKKCSTACDPKGDDENCSLLANDKC